MFSHIENGQSYYNYGPNKYSLNKAGNEEGVLLLLNFQLILADLYETQYQQGTENKFEYLSRLPHLKHFILCTVLKFVPVEIKTHCWKSA